CPASGEPVETHRPPGGDDEEEAVSVVIRIARCRAESAVRARRRAIAILVREAGEEFRGLVALASAEESVVGRLLREDDAKNAVRGDLTDDPVGGVVEWDGGAYSAGAGGNVRKLRRHVDARAL